MHNLKVNICNYDNNKMKYGGNSNSTCYSSESSVVLKKITTAGPFLLDGLGDRRVAQVL